MNIYLIKGLAAFAAILCCLLGIGFFINGWGGLIGMLIGITSISIIGALTLYAAFQIEKWVSTK